MRNVIIIGGGLAGLITSIQLAKAGIPTTVIEKKKYPFHRVCGEYISNETVPFLKSSGMYPEEFGPSLIDRLQLTSVNGKSAILPLDMGGFGISRYSFDHFLYQMGVEAGVTFLLQTEAEKITPHDNRFEVKTTKGDVAADLVIGAHGKRSKIDVSLGREFIKKRSPYIGVKYHLYTDHQKGLISLHNFNNGYCGISNIENGKTNLCYLSHRDNLRKHGSLAAMEEAILFRNPFIKSIFRNSEFIFEKPESINEISFATKGPVENHMLMTGDAAGMITPLCGNGMAMAIHSTKILSPLVIQFCQHSTYRRDQLELDYAKSWRSLFQKRLWAGRQIQRMFGHELTSDLAVNLARHAKPLARLLIKNTHGNTF